MNIAIDARTIADDITGSGRYVLKLIEGLRDFNLRDRRFSVTALYNKEPVHRVSGISTEVLVSNNRFKWEQFVLPKFLNAHDFDLYHATWNYGIPFFYKGTTVLTVLDVIPLKWPPYFLSKKILTLPEYLFSLYNALIKANKIISISKTSTNDVVSVYPFARKKITTIPLAVDIPVLPPHAHSPIPKPYIVYLGGVDKRKNIDGVIRAYANSKTKETHDLVIVGRNAQYYWPLINKLSLGEKVHLPGFVSEEEKFTILKDAACLVYPSFYEGFGIPVLEAMAVGTPVITSNTSSLPEVAGDCALLVNPHSEAEISTAIDKIVSSLEFSDELRGKGFMRLNSFSWERMIEDTITVYKGVAV